MTSTWWWLSFADPDGFRGVVITHAPDFISAVRSTHARRINPGGEVNGWSMPDEAGLGDPAPRWRDRLLNKFEAALASEDWTKQPLVSTLDHKPVDPHVVDEEVNEGS